MLDPFIIKLQALACKLIVKRFQHRCFPVKFFQNFKITYFEEYLRMTASTATSLPRTAKKSFRIFPHVEIALKCSALIYFSGHLSLILSNGPSQTDIISYA